MNSAEKGFHVRSIACDMRSRFGNFFFTIQHSQEDTLAACASGLELGSHSHGPKTMQRLAQSELKESKDREFSEEQALTMAGLLWDAWDSEDGRSALCSS